MQYNFKIFTLRDDLKLEPDIKVVRQTIKE